MRLWPVALLLAMASPALAQQADAPAADAPAAQSPEREANLADMRTSLAELRADLQRLRAELVASGAQGFQAAGGESAIDRMNAMEAQLMRLTDQAERLQNRINRVAADNERRLADLEFRLCELDETCDLSALTVPSGMGGLAPELAPSAPAPGMDDRPAGVATAAEQADFDRARAALEAGDTSEAARLFAQVAEAHAGGPLTAEALFLRGLALERGGDPRAAATTWLEGFAADPDGRRAGESLLGIARVIESQGDATAACLYLAEIPARFPGSAPAQEAEAALVRLGCGSADLGVLDPLLDPALDAEALADLAEHE
ncbi:tetratricopeptide repeat protein [Paracoccus bogoriensis]|uniref:tetratricopeptide repeat protein n=1 Tax=Paracoccus bogoriensis TaxID=242065 RepID=UPI001CA588B7|nr:tetratricopeptide repeat protein [Paracoccus bogoriensis]MBW7056882.1 tetratricopeptide repeat protein [Paracoccus bogoriensis]